MLIKLAWRNIWRNKKRSFITITAILIAVFLGIAVSIVSLAKLLEFFFESNELLVWSFFFGLILASIYYVGRLVKVWNIYNAISLLFGVTVAVGIAFLEPASENTATWYLLILLISN